MDSSSRLDDIDRAILSELQHDGRVTLAELGRRVGLSAPSVADRVRQLESWRIITGYTAQVDPRKVGLGVTAFIRLSPPSGSGLLADRLRSEIDEMPEVVDCHHVTGEDCYVLNVAVADMEHIREVVERLSKLGRTTTSIVISVLAESRPIVPPEAH